MSIVKYGINVLKFIFKPREALAYLYTHGYWVIPGEIATAISDEEGAEFLNTSFFKVKNFSNCVVNNVRIKFPFHFKFEPQIESKKGIIDYSIKINADKTELEITKLDPKTMLTLHIYPKTLNHDYKDIEVYNGDKLINWLINKYIMSSRFFPVINYATVFFVFLVLSMSSFLVFHTQKTNIRDERIAKIIKKNNFAYKISYYDNNEPNKAKLYNELRKSNVIPETIYEYNKVDSFDELFLKNEIIILNLDD